jgi:hypothetical protein
MNFFLKFFSIITDGFTNGNSIGNFVGKSLGNSVGNKKIITDASVPSVNPSVILLPTDLPTDKTLPTNDLPTDNFRL